jgi:hypothetical protein
MAKKKKYHESRSERKLMKKAGGMISEDRSAPALLPRNVMEKNYVSGDYGVGGYIDDLYQGVTKQMQEDSMDFKKVFKPSKY